MSHCGRALLVWILSVHCAAAEPFARCVVVRKPTRDQTLESAVDVDRLVAEYEGRAAKNEDWRATLTQIYDRFPLPVINLTLAQNHPAWNRPDRQLLLYVEAARQEPDDYANAAAVEQVVSSIRRELLPVVQDLPILVVEAHGAVRRRDVERMNIRINTRACGGNRTGRGDHYDVSWFYDGRRLKQTVSAASSRVGADQCIEIDGDRAGPCVVAAKPTAPELPVAPPPPKPPAPAQPSSQTSPPRVEPPTPPTFNRPLAVAGGATALTGFAIAGWAYAEMNSNLKQADQMCNGRLCAAEGAPLVRAAIRYKTVYYVSGAVGLVGLAALLASPYEYYTRWFSPRSERAPESDAATRTAILPIVTPQITELYLQGTF